MVYTSRDPRDIVVSYYYFTKMCTTYEDPISFNQFLKSFLSGDGELEENFWLDQKSSLLTRSIIMRFKDDPLA